MVFIHQYTSSAAGSELEPLWEHTNISLLYSAILGLHDITLIRVLHLVIKM